MSEGYRLAANYNQPLGNLLDIELIIPPGDTAFVGPSVIKHYDDGLVVPQLDGLDYTEGYAETTWTFGFLTFPQYAYLKSTYCGGGLTGKVTIYTTLGSTTFSRKNAIMKLKKPNEMRGTLWYVEAEVLFRKLADPT